MLLMFCSTAIDVATESANMVIFVVDNALMLFCHKFEEKIRRWNVKNI